MKLASHISLHKNHNALISVISNLFHSIIAVRSVSAIFCLVLKPLHANHKLSPKRCEKRMGAQRGSKVASTVGAAVGEKAHLGTKRR